MKNPKVIVIRMRFHLPIYNAFRPGYNIPLPIQFDRTEIVGYIHPSRYVYGFLG